MDCPCGSGQTYETCCQPYIEGRAAAPTAEALMRSRFSAYAQKQVEYLEKTSDPQTRMEFDFEGNRRWAYGAQFLKLEILRTQEEKNKGLVEFKAHFQRPGEAVEIHHEISKFRKQAGIWYFREGKMAS